MRGLRPPEQLSHKLLIHRLTQHEREKTTPPTNNKLSTQTGSPQLPSLLHLSIWKKAEIGKRRWWLLHALIPITEKETRL